MISSINAVSSPFHFPLTMIEYQKSICFLSATFHSLSLSLFPLSLSNPPPSLPADETPIRLIMPFNGATSETQQEIRFKSDLTRNKLLRNKKKWRSRFRTEAKKNIRSQIPVVWNSRFHFFLQNMSGWGQEHSGMIHRLTIQMLLISLEEEEKASFEHLWNGSLGILSALRDRCQGQAN